MGIHFDRGQALFALQRYQEAVVEYQQELAQEPGCVYSKANIASCLINLRKFADARVAVQETLAQAPEYGFAFYLLSFLEPKDGVESPALRAINEAVRLEPTVVRNVTRLATLLREQGRHGECLEATRRALELDPRHVDTLVLRAKTLEALGQPDDAAATLREALAINPEDPDAHLALGNVALACGDPGEALDALREARRISPVKHNNREKILDALARRLWPFRQIDAAAKWWKRQSELARWAERAATLTLLVGLHQVVRPTAKDPSPALTILYLLLVNGLLFVLRAPQFSKLVVRVLKRRELDLRRMTVLGENVRVGAWLAFSHWIASVLAIIASFSQGFAVFILATGLTAPPLFAQMRRGLDALALRLGDSVIVVGFVMMCVLPAVVAGAAVADGFWSVAWTIWGVLILFTGLEAAYRQRLARRRRG